MTENKQLIDINLCYPRLIKADGYPNNTLSSILFLSVTGLTKAKITSNLLNEENNLVFGTSIVGDLKTMPIFCCLLPISF